MTLIQRLILAVVVGIVVTLGCTLIGGILETLNVAIAVSVGDFLVKYSGGLGILAALWWYFAGGSFPTRQS